MPLTGSLILTRSEITASVDYLSPGTVDPAYPVRYPEPGQAAGASPALAPWAGVRANLARIPGPHPRLGYPFNCIVPDPQEECR